MCIRDRASDEEAVLENKIAKYDAFLTKQDPAFTVEELEEAMQKVMDLSLIHIYTVGEYACIQDRQPCRKNQMYPWLFQQKHRDQGTDAAGKKFDACQYRIIRNRCIVCLLYTSSCNARTEYCAGRD